MNWLRDILTVNDPVDGKTYYDLVRVAVALGVVAGIAMEAYSVIYKTPFDFVAYGTGFGLLIAGAGGAMALRRDTEPPHDHHEDDH